MKPDHEAAKKWAGSLGPENTFGACGPDMLNLARAYLDLVACEQRAVAAERERDALKAIFGKCTGRFARVRGQCEPVEGYAERPNDILRSIDDLCEHIAALKKRVAVMDVKLEYAAKYINSPDGEFTFPDGDSVECSGGASYSDLVYKVAELERELDAARKVCDFMEIVAAGPDFHLNDYTRTIQEKAKAVLAAYRATQTKEPRDEAK